MYRFNACRTRRVSGTHPGFALGIRSNASVHRKPDAIVQPFGVIPPEAHITGGQDHRKRGACHRRPTCLLAPMADMGHPGVDVIKRGGADIRMQPAQGIQPFNVPRFVGVFRHLSKSFSEARARANRRLTVATDVPVAAAVSGMVNSNA